MKSSKNIFLAFLLNFVFVIIEVVGGFLTGSIAILSDSVHDAGDCLSIGIAFILEKKSNKKSNSEYTYGYRRYSIISALISCSILIVGSVLVIYNSILRIINPVKIDGIGMFIIAIVGVLINGLAALKTAKSNNLNEKTINLHMLEDVLGWVVVLIGSIFVWAFDVFILDSILSIFVAVFVILHAFKHLIEAVSIILEKSPKNFQDKKFVFELEQIQNVKDVHHLHVWTLDGESLLATVHIKTDATKVEDFCRIKKETKELAKKYNINHITIQIDFIDESCKTCELNSSCEMSLCHHHHHHHD